jgi:DMSO/TMAO reductase YedYZ molybdopterin-dependent catalytic subunit
MYVALMPHFPTDRRTPEGRIVRTEDPPNEELDLARLTDRLTPNDQFYVRCHGDVPTATPEWRVAVLGLVERPLALSVDELRALPQADAVVTLECAGNRRTLQRPMPGGVAWAEGAVSTARWGGVRLTEVLARAGVHPDARHVRLVGADSCDADGAEVPFARSIPIERARTGGALLALTMNDEPLPEIHGAPVRVVVPRFYAMDSVKWLRRIELARDPEPGPYQSEDYQLWYDNTATGEEIGPMRVASVIAAPRPPSEVRAGRQRIRGAAWTGTGTIVDVQVSTDGGASWLPAQLQGEAIPGAWVLWEAEWTAVPGEHTLIARASDSAGNRQPETLQPNRKGYANNFVVPVTVRVTP